MTESELIALLTARFYENFADEVAAQIVCDADLDLLYRLVTSRNDQLERNLRHPICFRGAYVLDRIYFARPERFAPYVERFFRADFAACSDPSARRHFSKIMSDLLTRHTPDADVLERIAEAAGEWAVDQQAKVAVKIGAIEVLQLCRERVAWVAEAWDDLLTTMQQNPTPGIESRLRKRWR